ncbi:Protein kinase domain [Macleaya cordata]|uniref:Protein kinase domain n=1 Tax=Macleaya cordata TaxID=56857 RepID=A0A200Q6Y7_MACCD|nr:Protein kinase domain [Macleaya cordata]
MVSEDMINRCKYKMIELIGKGGYGMVYSAVNKETKEKVAIKKISNPSNNKSRLMSALREIRLLRHLDHDNIIPLKDVMIQTTTVVDDMDIQSSFMDVHLVYQLMNTDLASVIRSSSIQLTDDRCKSLLVQLLQGVEYLHSLNILHRDIKPGNVLVDSNFNLKICDFGMSRVVANEEFMKVCVEPVGSRGYKAPELLFGCTKYGTAVDVWSVGVVFAELLSRKQLFPRAKNFIDDIKNMMHLFGNPGESDIEFIEDERIMDVVRSHDFGFGFHFPYLFPIANPLAVDLLRKMLTFNPSKRITVAEALEHPYIRHLSERNCIIYSSPSPVEHPEDLDVGNYDDEGVEKIKDLIWKEMLHYHPEGAAAAADALCTD